MSDGNGAVRHESQGEKGMFFVQDGGQRIAEMTYAREGACAVVDHTWVDPGHRGGTLARDLADAAVQWARAEGVRIRPVCGYMRKVLDTTPDYADVREPSSS